MNDTPRAGDRPAGGRAGPRIIPCEEQGPIDVPLEELLDHGSELRLNPEIETGGFFRMSLKRRVVSLRACGYIGYIPLTDTIVVHVRPRRRISDPSLSRIIKLSGERSTVLTSLRDYTRADSSDDSLLDVYATALVRHVQQIASNGLLREYTRRTGSSSSPRGRVLIGDTYRSRVRGQHHKAQVAWYDRTIDNAANRCIKYAIWLLARSYSKLGQGAEASRACTELNRLYPLFEGVRLDHTLGFLSAAEVTGAASLPTTRSYYRDALNVASAAIHQRSVLLEEPYGPLRLSSEIVNMDNVFEAYVRNAVRRYVDANGLSLAVLDGNKEGRRGLYNGIDEPGATPDIVVHRDGSVAPLIVEVKNVPVAGKRSGREHLNQALTYALVYKASRILLVHPRSSELEPGGLHHMGDVEHVEVYQYRFDLSAEDLLSEEELFGGAIERLVDPESTPSEALS